ncbi:MAG: hypothetical protein Q8P67_08090, partial [archaeon]|nr:hypothetical protein [archaeon]
AVSVALASRVKLYTSSDPSSPLLYQFCAKIGIFSQALNALAGKATMSATEAVGVLLESHKPIESATTNGHGGVVRPVHFIKLLDCIKFDLQWFARNPTPLSSAIPKGSSLVLSIKSSSLNSHLFFLCNSTITDVFSPFEVFIRSSLDERRKKRKE